MYPDLGLNEVEAALAAPLRFKGRLLGSLAVYFGTPRLFTADELQLFEAVTEQCAQAIERARLLESESEARVLAESANAAKAKFLRAMSHDLRTPLNAILGYAELLHGGFVGTLASRQTEFVDRILASTTVLRELIEEVLEFARIEAGRVEIRAMDLSVDPLLAQVATLVAPQAKSKGITLTLEPAPQVRARGDANRIGQILSNLVTNAVKYTPEGGRIALSASADDSRVAIRVSDTGPGIREQDLERIFEPFVQLDAEEPDVARHGVGLGLAISRELARAMAGDLEADSRPGEGATFTLRLPRADAPVPSRLASARTA
jgi:signal transduction histidine kinase